MKKGLLLLVFVVTLGFTGLGQIITEPFNYTPDATNGLAKQSGGAWYKFNSGDSIFVESGNLTYTGFPASTGNRVTYGGAGTDYYRPFTSQTSGTVYMSFLINVAALGSLNATGGYTIGFLDGTTSNYYGRVWIRLSGTSYNLGINPGSVAANTNWATNTLAVGTTYLVVISYQFIATASNDVAKLWINPAVGGTEPSSNATATNNTGTDAASIQRMFFRQDGNTATPGTVQVDEMRVGTAWTDVTPSGGNVAPTVTTQAVSSIGTTTATGNGNITSTGGVNPTVRGVCWDLYVNADPDINDSHSTENGDFETGAFTGSITSLSAETRYKVVAYATNTQGTGYGSAVNFWTLSTEPLAHTTTFTNTPVSQTQIDLAFDAASTITNADGYVILRKSGSAPTGAPTDGTAYTVGTTVGDGTVAAVVSTNSATTASITGLTAGTTYYFTIFPYNYNGANNETYNYKTDGTVPGTNGSTLPPNDVNSFVDAPGTQVNPVTVSSLADTDPEAVEVFRFKINDVGTDGLQTKVTQVKFSAGANNTASWTAAILGVKLSTDGGSTFVTIGTPTIEASAITIPITSGNLNVSNGGSSTVSLFIYLKTSGLTDNQVLEFSVPVASHGFIADATGSTFLTTFVGATTSNQMTISVVATKLLFVAQPSNVGMGYTITPAVTVSAADANGNRDLDYVTGMSVTASGATLTGSPVSATPVSGLGTFSTLSFSTLGTGVTLEATSGSLTLATSTAFNVLLWPVAGEIVINQFNPAYNTASNEYIELVNKTNKTFDLSQLKIMYSSAAGSGPSSMGTLSGTLNPYSFWLLSPDATITVGQNVEAIPRDGSFTAGMAGTAGQIAVETLGNTIIDGVAYGTITVNKLGEGSPAPAPSVAKDGLKRVADGVDNNTNSIDFANVSNASIYLRNSSSYCISATYTLPSTTYLADVVVSGSTPAVTMSGNTTIAGKLTVLAGSFTVATSQTLTVTGTLTNSGDNTALVINEGGSLITNGTVSGGATMTRTISGPAWHLMSAPVSSQSIFAGYTDMYAWDETNNLWLNDNGGSFPDASYLPGKGYLVSWVAGASKDFAGTLNSGNYITGSGSVPTLSYTTGKGSGYNLLGNPYPSAMNGSIDTWTKTNVDNSIWVYDNGEYLTWNGSVGTMIDGIIPAMQGFWVKVSAEGVATLTIPNTARTHNAHSYYKSTESIQDVLLLNIEGNGYKDGIVVNFNNEATSAYDGRFDVRKMYGDAAAPQLYCRASDEELSIDVLPYSNSEVVVPLELKVGKDENYTISVKENTFFPTVTILLEDIQASKTINLQNEPSYSFAASVNDSPGRFNLHFGGTLGINDPKKDNDVTIYSAGNTLYISNNTGTIVKGDVFVYNLMGQQMMQQKLNEGALTKISLDAVTGYYLVKVITNQKAYSGKVFVQ